MILNIQKKKEKIPLIFKQFKLYDNKKPELWRHEMNSTLVQIHRNQSVKQFSSTKISWANRRVETVIQLTSIKAKAWDKKNK